MKAWDDNSVTETGTAHDGRFTTMALFLSFLCLLSTVLWYFFCFCWESYKVCFAATQKVLKIVFFDLLSWRKMLTLFLICGMKVPSRLSITLISNSAIYWRKEIRKINLCLFWQCDGRPVVWGILQFRVEKERQRESGIWGNMCFYAQ